MYRPLTPSLDCQQTWRAPQSFTWPNDRIRFFEAASGCYSLSVMLKRGCQPLLPGLET